MKRREAREIALCLLFDYSFNKEEDTDEIMDLYLKYIPEKGKSVPASEIKDDPYISTAFYGAVSKTDELDSYIEKAARNWKPERISRISRAILRLAIFEMLYMDDIPVRVSANEAVELAKTFDHENGYSFVNGILGNIVASLGIGESDKEGKAAEPNDNE